METVYNYIINGMARALYVDAYASAIEEGEIVGPGAGAGEDWMDVAPETPAYARDNALILTGRIEERNGMSLTALIYQAARADGISTETPDDAERYWYEVRDSKHANYAEAFGHYLAMESLGHGVSWFDDHKAFPLALPHITGLEIKER